jgi:hypothetical protein
MHEENLHKRKSAVICFIFLMELSFGRKLLVQFVLLFRSLISNEVDTHKNDINPLTHISE